MHLTPNHFFHWSWCQSVFLLDWSNSAKLAHAYPSYSLEGLILYFFSPGFIQYSRPCRLTTTSVWKALVWNLV